MALVYCIKCKKKVPMQGGKISYYSNGTPVSKGVCTVCGSKVTRILTKEERIVLREGTKVEGNESQETTQDSSSNVGQASA